MPNRVLFLFLKRSLVLIFIVTILLSAFFSNRVLQFIFKEKVWVHRVNSIEKFNSANQLFYGVELDVIYNKEENLFYVKHSTKESTNLSLKLYMNSIGVGSVKNYWIDLKNLDSNNGLSSSSRLNSITKELSIKNDQIIVESKKPQFLDYYYDKGFLTSYYLPSELYLLNNEDLKNKIESINNNLNHCNYISTSYKDYKILKEKFPEKKKIIWFTVYGSMNKFKARIILCEILFDKNVDVLLLPFSFN